ncbi:PPE family protein [Mycobacterium kyorinense]|uniref:PPE family protein n=1 Tax=Mycobacterium kyorinense TaxID=487514 RepID=A0A1X1YC32_9MYCO|nr:PPE family protein [Mycobacterium kyorinense]ORW08594.1 hypothetical protein AWC14_22900 [Mycobacterium kyorinense]
MDYGMLPPEINSARMYSGPGPGSMLAAAAAWDELAAELGSAAVSYSSVIASLTGGSWLGPSSTAMAASAAPYVAWLHATAAQAEQTANQVKAAVGAYETAFAMTVPPPVIAANRAQLMALIATNVLGQNAPAIAATEAQYGEMWAQDAAAMYGYAGASAAVTSQVAPFSPAPTTTNPAGPASQAVTVAQTTGTSAGTDAQAMLSHLTTAAPQALQGLASPTSSTSASSALDSLKSYMYPVSMMSMMPMRGLSMVNMLKSLSSTTGAASKAVTAARPALAGALVASTGAAGPAANLGSAVPAVSAGMGSAVSMGPLSVPQSWSAATAPAVSPVAAGLPANSPSAPPVSGPAGMPLMPVANMAGRVPAGGTPHYDMRPTVIPRSPSAG